MRGYRGLPWAWILGTVLAAATLDAQPIPTRSLMPVSVTELGTCATANKGAFKAVYDSSVTSGTCAAGGSFTATCQCNGTNWVVSGGGGDPTLVGDVDGLGSANDLDEAAVRDELESVLRLQALQGAVTDSQVPDGITVTLAATATALAANPADCSANQFANAIAASGNLTCSAITDADVPDTITVNAATALAANGANCSAGSYPLGVDASGAAESCTVAGTILGATGSTADVLQCANGTGGATIKACTTGLVGNLSLVGNTLSTTNTNGSLILNPDGTGDVALFGMTSGDLRIRLATAPSPSTGAAFRCLLGDASSGCVGLYQGLFIPNETFPVIGLYSGQVILARDGFFSWYSSDTDFSGSRDLLLRRQAANVIRVDDGSGGMGKAMFGYLVEANTAGSGSPNVLTATESLTTLTNEGATAENYYTLPSAAAGMDFTFVVQDSDGIRITAAAGDTIRPIAGAAASAPGGFIRCATLGAFITLRAINATEWIAVGSAGVWTIDV